MLQRAVVAVRRGLLLAQTAVPAAAAVHLQQRRGVLEHLGRVLQVDLEQQADQVLVILLTDLAAEAEALPQLVPQEALQTLQTAAALAALELLILFLALPQDNCQVVHITLLEAEAEAVVVQAVLEAAVEAAVEQEPQEPQILAEAGAAVAEPQMPERSMVPQAVLAL